MQMDNSPFRLHFSVDDQNSYILAQSSAFYLKFRHGKVHSFLWTIKFQSGQVNSKSYQVWHLKCADLSVALKML